MNIDINKKKYTFEDLNDIMDILLGENGCPWDKAQTHESVMECLIEECYEVIDAVQKDNKEELCEELGDVLLQVVFNAKISEKNNGFTINEVIDGLSKKMISRHTHIFKNQDINVDSTEKVLDIWEENKKKEKGYSTVKESMQLVPKSFPALMRATKVQKKAAKAGYEKQEISELIEETINLLTTLKTEIETEKTDEKNKYGQILLKATNISRVFKINPELALTNAIETYINEFENFVVASKKKGV